MSFSMKERMSGISWRIWANRSIPKPKAKPDQILESILTAANTAGSTMPQPPSSIHPLCEHVRQPSPRHSVQVISYSADGSVKGKYAGRKRDWMPAPKYASVKT